LKQKTSRLKSRDEFLVWAEKIKCSSDYKNAKEVFFKVMTSQFPSYDSRNIYHEMKELFPNAKIAGSSMTNFKAGSDNERRERRWVSTAEDLSETYAVISAFFFDSSTVTIFDIDATNYNSFGELISYLRNKLKAIPNLKGVEIFCAEGQSITADGLDLVTKGLEKVPFFGMIAGKVYIETVAGTCHSIVEQVQLTNVTQFVIGNEFHNDGAVIVAYSGKDLHIKVNYTLGWRPLGKEMTVTETLGTSGLSMIENVPAIEIYKKYLNIVPNEFLMFNVFEFPMLINRGGVDLARVPLIYDETGRLYFSTDIRRGEKIRLSYGNPHDLLKATEKVGCDMKLFDPQAISLCICGARTIFLDKEYISEVEVFKKILPDTLYAFGNGEIYKHEGRGGLAGSAIISVGFREGPARQFSVYNPIKVRENVDGIVPLAKRLATFLEVMTDELKAKNFELKDAVIAANEANKSKSQFLSNMSHEIRTPINAILGMNEMILRESENETILEYAENIRSAGNSLLGIVNDILDFSKIEAGKMEIIPVEYALSSLLNDLVNMVQKRAEKKNLAFHIDADENLPSELFGDEIRIKQVITNILTNAVKYTEKGGVTLTVTFKNISDDKILLCVSVKDTGIGIKPEDIQKLFSAFERIEEKRNRTIEGTGLGMNITQRLLDMMNSKLEVASVYGEGSTFSFEIVQKVINSHPIGNFAENFRHSLSQHKKYKEKFTAPDARILVVDDTVMNLTVVKGLLKQTKVRIDTAESGFECLKLITQKHYDIIFLDHRMPGIDGIETLKRMKIIEGNLNIDTPVISLTANAISGARQIYLDAGFQGYLTKPIDSAKLEEMIIEYLPKDKVNFKDDDAEVVETAEESLPDWLKNVDGINVNEGVEHCGGVEPYLDALTVFAQSVISGAREIAEFYRREDFKGYTVKVHALKSSARVIGADELSERAKRLEDAGNSGYIDEIKRFTDGLLELYISFADKLAPLIKVDDDDEDKPLIDDDALNEAYEAMTDAAQTFDFDTLQFVIESLEEYKLPPEHKEKFDALKIAAAKPDWETVLKLLKN